MVLLLLPPLLLVLLLLRLQLLRLPLFHMRQQMWMNYYHMLSPCPTWPNCKEYERIGTIQLYVTSMYNT